MLDWSTPTTGRLAVDLNGCVESVPGRRWWLSSLMPCYNMLPVSMAEDWWRQPLNSNNIYAGMEIPIRIFGMYLYAIRNSMISWISNLISLNRIEDGIWNPFPPDSLSPSMDSIYFLILYFDLFITQQDILWRFIFFPSDATTRCAS